MLAEGGCMSLTPTPAGKEAALRSGCVPATSVQSPSSQADLAAFGKLHAGFWNVGSGGTLWSGLTLTK